MKITNKELVERINLLAAFAKKDLALPVKLAYMVGKNIRKMEDAYKDYDVQRVKIVTKYKVADKDEVAEEHMSEFKKDIEELLDIDTDIDIDKVEYAVIEELQLSVGDMLSIDFMIKD